MVIRGLSRYRKNDLAKRLAKQYYWAVAEVYKNTHTFWENYAPSELTQGSESRYDFCGWTGLVPITVLKEYLND
jgi:neutral trehalase